MKAGVVDGTADVGRKVPSAEVRPGRREVDLPEERREFERTSETAKGRVARRMAAGQVH